LNSFVDAIKFVAGRTECPDPCGSQHISADNTDFSTLQIFKEQQPILADHWCKRLDESPANQVALAAAIERWVFQRVT
jgi:hypothetical protein